MTLENSYLILTLITIVMKRTRSILNTLPSIEELGHPCCDLINMQVADLVQTLNAKATLP